MHGPNLTWLNFSARPEGTGISITGYGDSKIFVVSEQETTKLPVRSALSEQRTGGLVVRWVTTSEYPLLYVFAHLSHPWIRLAPMVSVVTSIYFICVEVVNVSLIDVIFLAEKMFKRPFASCHSSCGGDCPHVP